MNRRVFSFRVYQWKHIRRLTRYLMSEKIVGYIAGTGAGKSSVLAVLADRLLRSGRYRTFLCLVPQGHLKSKILNSGGGLWHPADPSVASSHPVFRAEITTPVWKPWTTISDFTRDGFLVACYAALTQPNTLKLILEWVKSLPDDALDTLLIFLDEGHHRGGKDGNALGRLISALMSKGAGLVLTTATGFRTDGREVVDIEKHPCVVRSLSDQVLDGLAPSDWTFSTVVLDGLSFSGISSKDMAKAAQIVVQQWRDEGQPIVIIEVPCSGGASLDWQKALVEAFRPYLPHVSGSEDPILQAVGEGKAVRDMVALDELQPLGVGPPPPESRGCVLKRGRRGRGPRLRPALHPRIKGVRVETRTPGTAPGASPTPPPPNQGGAC